MKQRRPHPRKVSGAKVRQDHRPASSMRYLAASRRESYINAAGKVLSVTTALFCVALCIAVGMGVYHYGFHAGELHQIEVINNG